MHAHRFAPLPTRRSSGRLPVKTLRYRSASLALTCLLAGLISLGLRPAWPAPAAPGPALDRYESAIRDFEARDRVSPPPRGGTVFVGSSTFTRWTALEDDFRAFHAFNRGFGGSTLPEVTAYVDRIIFPYQPQCIVVYAGTNDIADGHPARQVASDFQAFVARVRTRLRDVPICFISLSMAPCRVRWASEYAAANALIRQWCASQPDLKFVDLTGPMRDARGRPREALYVEDRLHMNRRGYELWIPIVRRALQDVVAPHSMLRSQDREPGARRSATACPP